MLKMSGKAIRKRQRQKLLKLYTEGPSAYGSVTRLQKLSKVPRKDVKRFLETVPAYTKYRTFRKKFNRLKVIVYDINEIWSVDLAYVDKLAKYNRNVKYLMVAVDCMSRYVRVQPLLTKDAEETARAFQKMVRAKQPKKVWTDKGTEFKGAFAQFCKKRGIECYTTESETKSSFAERNIRSLKNIIYRYLEQQWTYSYIDQLQQFVRTINSRVNRMTKLAPNKVTKKHVAQLISRTANESAGQIRKPRYKSGDFVRIAKPDLPFRKGYKQTFTDEVFEIVRIATLNPPTYNIIDATGDKIQGKFYEPELARVREIDSNDD